MATCLVVATYLVLAILANWNAWTTGATRALQSSQDPKLNAWLIAWTPFAVSHGVNPLFSHWVNVPYGANYSANVAIPLLGIIVSPITALWGPVAAVNFLISLAFFGSAIAGYCFVRHWTTWRPAAFLGGLLFGFSPYVVAEGIAHVHTMFVCLIPFIFIVLDEIFIRQRYSQRVLGLVLGLLLIAQYFISSELLATTAVMALIAGVLVALFNLREVRKHLMTAVPGMVLAVGLAIIVLAYPIMYAVRGPLHYTYVLPSGQYQSDLLSAVLPTSNQLIAPTSAAAISDHFANNLSENGAYLGIPLVVLLVAAGALCRRSKVVVIGVLLTLSAYVLSLGSPLLIHNNNTGLHLPGGNPAPPSARGRRRARPNLRLHLSLRRIGVGRGGRATAEMASVAQPLDGASRLGGRLCRRPDSPHPRAPLSGDHRRHAVVLHDGRGRCGAPKLRCRGLPSRRLRSTPTRCCGKHPLRCASRCPGPTRWFPLAGGPPTWGSPTLTAGTLAGPSGGCHRLEDLVDPQQPALAVAVMECPDVHHGSRRRRDGST